MLTITPLKIHSILIALLTYRTYSQLDWYDMIKSLKSAKICILNHYTLRKIEIYATDDVLLLAKNIFFDLI